MKMNTNTAPKFTFSDIMISTISKLSFVETIHAAATAAKQKDESDIKSPPKGFNSEEEKDVGDYSSLPKKYLEKLECHCSSSNRGKTGAGITGSRSGKSTCPTAPSKLDLPTSAKKPGLLRHIHNAARLRLPQCFEGAIVSVKQRSDASNWVVGHSLLFSSVSPGGYKFMLSYLDRKGIDTCPYFVMEAAPGGQVSCEVRVKPSNWMRAAVVSQFANTAIYSFESVFDAYFKSCTASIIAVNQEFIALHFLQQISTNWAAGMELVARGKSSDMSSASAALRWSSKTSSASATVGDRGLDVCYARALKPFLTVATMFEMGFKVRRAVATLAYEWTTPDWVVKASMDSDGLVGTTLQRTLGGKRAQLACALSALLNHPNDKFRLGFEITCAIE